MRYFVFAGVCALALSSVAAAHPTAKKQADDHAPLGVMGDHLHKEGEWMVGYHYERTRMSGYRNGSDKVSNTSVMRAYGEAAINMDMRMHMFEIMYGIRDDLTLMVMPQYMEMNMTHSSLHGGGHTHQHAVEGFGDTEVTGLYSLFREQDESGVQRAHLNLGLSLPTGAIDKTFRDHHGNLYRLPYNMQFGSGTVDPILGATFADEREDWSWGAQTINTIRVGKNRHGYRQGNDYTATTWIARNLTDEASVSFRLKGEAWGNVSGRDASLPINIIAGANPNEQSGERVMAYVGLNLLGAEPQSLLAGHRVAAEFGVPLYERFSGPQPDTDYRWTLGWQYAF